MNTKKRIKKSMIFGYTALAGALLISGTAQSGLPSVFDLGDATASFYGEAELDQSGINVTGVGDVNGDGFEDVLVAAPGANSQAGKVYLIFGRSAGLQPLTSLANADVTFTGEKSSDQAGFGIASAGDFNRDGLGDIAISAPYNASKGYGTGKVYIVYGRRSGWTSQMPLANADVSFLGEASMGLAGFSMASLGDINKDGYPDLGIGAHGMNSSAGKVYVILGAASSTFSRNMELKGRPSFKGEASNNFAGFSIAEAGDINKDGYADFLIGAYGNSQKASRAGKVYVMLGRSGSWTADALLSQVSSYYLGQTAKDYVGYSVAGAGDLDSDGRSDFLIGAPGRDDAGDASGMVGVVYGRTGTFSGYDMSQVNARIIGQRTGDNLGARVAALGDIDRDRYGDFLVSAHYSDLGSQDAGAAYLIRGGATRMSGTLSSGAAATIFVGELALDQAGWGMAGVGDIDNDGFRDIAISAYGSDINGAASGITYLISTGEMVDADGDGFSEAQGDCDDADANVHPGAYDIPGDGVDQDCNGSDSQFGSLMFRNR
ncbi:MAG: MopE-related protein [Myxococcota bacterium]